VTNRGRSDPSIIVLAKAPLPGRAKTRLCPPCTPVEAAALAEAALADTLDTVSRVRARRLLVLDGPPGPWLRRGFRRIAQRGGSLDERLAAAFDDVGGPAILIGMDTPHVSGRTLEVALEALRGGGQAVLGLATDGGWWAIGLRRPDPRVFLGIPMSSPATGREQQRRLRALGLQWRTLPPLRDVDRFGDAVAVAAEASGSRFARAVRAVSARLATDAVRVAPAPVLSGSGR
jgi:uncharacterized protein